MENNTDRIEILNAAIDKKFCDIDMYERDDSDDEYSRFVLDMIEIDRNEDSACRAHHLFNDEVYLRVRFPRDIQMMIEAGDVFLVKMGLLGDDWHVLYTSPLYETFDDYDDDDDSEDDAAVVH